MLTPSLNPQSEIELLLNQRINPPLKWAGGKRWLLPHLAPIWLPYKNNRLVEPFCGGLAVALGLQPKKALLNDINPHAINFYQWLQKGLNIRQAMKNNESFYYQQRQEFNRLTAGHSAKTKKAAELFYYLNRTGYNGLCRFNKKGGFNVPFGSYKKINYRGDFSDLKVAFANWQFTQGNFSEITLNQNDFIYADPPYDVEFRQYASGGFEWQQQVNLAEWLSRHTGPVVLSNQATKRVIELYQDHGFHLQYYDAPRRISCNGNRKPAKEVLALKNIR